MLFTGAVKLSTFPQTVHRFTFSSVQAISAHECDETTFLNILAIWSDGE